MAREMELVGLDDYMGSLRDTATAAPCFTLDQLAGNAPYIGDIIQDFLFWFHLAATDANNSDIKTFQGYNASIQQNGRWLSTTWDTPQNGVPCHTKPATKMLYTDPKYAQFTAGGPFTDKVGNIIFMNWQDSTGSPTALSEAFKKNGLWHPFNDLYPVEYFSTAKKLGIPMTSMDSFGTMNRYTGNNGWSTFLSDHVLNNAKYIYQVLYSIGVDQQKLSQPINLYFDRGRIVSAATLEMAGLGVLVAAIGAVAILVLGPGSAPIVSAGTSILQNAVKKGGVSSLKNLSGTSLAQIAPALLNPSNPTQASTVTNAAGYLDSAKNGDILSQLGSLLGSNQTSSGGFNASSLQGLVQNNDVTSLVNSFTSLFGLRDGNTFGNPATVQFTSSGGPVVVQAGTWYFNGRLSRWIQIDPSSLQTAYRNNAISKNPNNITEPSGANGNFYFLDSSGKLVLSYDPPSSTSTSSRVYPVDTSTWPTSSQILTPFSIITNSTINPYSASGAASAATITQLLLPINPSAFQVNGPTLFDHVNNTMQNIRNMLLVPQMADGLASGGLKNDIQSCDSLSQIPVMKNLFHMSISGGYAGMIPTHVQDDNGQAYSLLPLVMNSKETNTPEMKKAFINMALGCPIDPNVFGELSILSCEDDIRKLKQGMSASTLDYVLPAGIPADKVACYANYLKSLGVNVITRSPDQIKKETEGTSSKATSSKATSPWS